MNKPKTFILSGGEDFVTPPLQIPEGVAREALNYEQNYDTGYSRINGYRKLVNDTTPGEGAVLGLVVYNDEIYMFRNKVGGTEAGMWKATPAEYRIGSKASGDAANLWGTNIVVSNGQWDEVTTGVTLQPDGYYEFAEHNFKATASTTTTAAAGSHDISGHSGKLYGVDGKSPAFEFDGSTFTQITSTYTPNTPQHVAANGNRLALGFRAGEVAMSVAGSPTDFSGGTAGSIGVTDFLTGMSPGPQGTLFLFTKDKTYVFYGMEGSLTAETAQLKKYSRNVGAFPYTVKTLGGMTLFYDTWGLTELQTSDRFGDIITNSLSAKVQTNLTARQPQTSVIVNSKAQYRLYTPTTNNARTECLIATLIQGKNLGFTHATYPFQTHCATTGYIGNDEYSLVGTGDGEVYHMDIGNSFDGASYKSRIKLPFNFFDSPTYEKKFRKFILNVGSVDTTALSYTLQFNSGAVDEPTNTGSTTLTKVGPIIGQIIIGQFVVGVQEVSKYNKHIKGIGKNASIILESNSATEEPHVLKDISFIYELLRIEH